MYKISVIIPIYNAESYLEKTINSVINQSIGFENIELILIDDNSTDNSKKIIKKYSNNYSNIIPIFLDENHGFAGFGRNIGIKKSTSKYIMFLDNDDDYQFDLCETLYNHMIKENADLICCNYNIIDLKTDYIRKCGVNYDTTSPTNEINNQDIIFYKDILVWNKLFKKEIILKNNIFFKTNGYGEDLIFCIEYFINSNKLIHVNNYYGYNHYDHGKNLSSVSLNYNLQVLNSYYEVLHLFDEYSIKIDLNKMFYNNVQTSIERSILMETNYKDIKKFISEISKFEKKINFENKCISNPILKIINFLILKNHITLISSIIYIISIFSNNKKLKSIYRTIFLNKRRF